ncbi:MAG: hypothetical protein KBF26_13065 [Opitutaceae bacterium]|nr:hypothetical protein [Opitutaceae bacterium]
MPVIRILLAGLVALFALCATLFAAAVVLVTGMLGFILMLLRPRSVSVRATGRVRTAASAQRQSAMRPDGAIDVVATKVPDKS